MFEPDKIPHPLLILEEEISRLKGCLEDAHFMGSYWFERSKLWKEENEKKDARIKELESDLAQSEICIRAKMEVIDEAEIFRRNALEKFDDQAAIIRDLREKLAEVQKLRDQEWAKWGGQIKIYEEGLRLKNERIKELEDRLHMLKEHNFVNAVPDGQYALRILQSYRAMCDCSWSDVIGAAPTNPLCIEMNKVNEKRKAELDEAIRTLSEGKLEASP